MTQKSAIRQKGQDRYQPLEEQDVLKPSGKPQNLENKSDKSTRKITQLKSYLTITHRIWQAVHPTISKRDRYLMRVNL